MPVAAPAPDAQAISSLEAAVGFPLPAAFAAFCQRAEEFFMHCLRRVHRLPPLAGPYGCTRNYRPPTGALERGSLARKHLLPCCAASRYHLDR